DCLRIELAGGVAVVASALLQLLADQRAVVRFVLVYLAQRLPLGAVSRPVVHEDDERSCPGALGLEHAVEEIVQLGVAEGAHRYLKRPRARSTAPFALSRKPSSAAGAWFTAMRVTCLHISSA